MPGHYYRRKDLTVLLEDRPGTLAAMGEALGNAGVNIDGVAGFAVEIRGVFHVLVEDAEEARNALAAAGIGVEAERDVLVLTVEDRPGVLGSVCRRIADAGVNIELVYVATGTRLVIGADDLEKAGSVI